MKNYCLGCRNNFYNGNNNLKIRECWSKKNAKVVWRKEVHVDQNPPWKQKAKRTYDCYHRARYIYIKPDREY